MLKMNATTKRVDPARRALASAKTWLSSRATLLTRNNPHYRSRRQDTPEPPGPQDMPYLGQKMKSGPRQSTLIRGIVSAKSARACRSMRGRRLRPLTPGS